MSQNQLMTTIDNSSSGTIKRKAINSNGHLGSLYDGCRDRLIVQHDSSLQGQQIESSQTAECVVINGNLDVSRNILQIIGVEDDLRLSLLLEISHRIGIVAVLNDSIRINEHTRLLYYSWIDREEQISDEVLKKLSWNELLKHGTIATHIISGITYGIDIIVILHLSSERGPNEIDRILQKIRSSLSNGTDLISLITPEENDLLSRNVKITIHSNICDLTGLSNVSKLLHQIDLIKKNPNQCLPVTYSLRPLTLFCSQHTGKTILFRALPSELNNKLEQYVLHYRTMRTTLKSVLHEDVRKFLSGYLDGRLYGANQQHLGIDKKYYKERDRLSELVIGFRSGQTETSVVNDALIHTERSTLRNNINELIQQLNDLKAKAHLINDLRNHHFSYRNAVERDIDRHDNEETARTKLMPMNDYFVRLLCSNDTLNRENQEKLNKFLSDLLRERQENPHLHLVYADFSYCSYKLPTMSVMSSNYQSSVPVLKTSVHSSTDEILNILLLGETGVGKSTFINALANYLTFDSLTQAESNEPIVIIPVSFLITVGKNFEERTIKFGERDRSNNENFNDVGQSVTQHCKSYMFDLKRNGRKFRIIDTPGFGDTRGLDQDDQNMQHILQYISHLTHLNAICFLLKPNSSRLNMFFRTCLTQLFSFLAPTARKNVIFCFTNARSTFYTPGDTSPLLKAMLADSSMNDIPFQKENTFCFDSESFRYLVALRNKITFTEEDEDEYQKSWSTSVKESKRLIDYIQNKLRPYYMQRNR